MLTDPTSESILTDNTMEGLEANQRLEDLLGQEAVKMGQTILLIQVRLSLVTLIILTEIYPSCSLRSPQQRARLR